MNNAEQRNSTSGVIDKNGSDQFDTRRQEFRKLHEGGCFVIPNPWDVGSARYLQHLGFPALATTSAGFAFSRGLPDSDLAVSRDQSLAHIAEIAAAVDLPVNADFASGYGIDPQGVADSVARCVATGVAGLSVEDATGERSAPLYDLPIAAERSSPRGSSPRAALEVLAEEAVEVGEGERAVEAAEAPFLLDEPRGADEAGPRREGQRGADADAPDAECRDVADA